MMNFVTICTLFFSFVVNGAADFSKIETIVYNTIYNLDELSNTLFLDETTIQQQYITQLTDIYTEIENSEYSSYADIGARTAFLPGYLNVGINDKVLSESDEIILAQTIKDELSTITDETVDMTISCSTIGTSKACEIIFDNEWINLDYYIELINNDKDVSSIFTYVELNGRIGDGDEVIAIVTYNGIFYEWDLTFLDKSGDCPAGCIFTIEYNLTVLYYSSNNIVLIPPILEETTEIPVPDTTESGKRPRPPFGKKGKKGKKGGFGKGKGKGKGNGGKGKGRGKDNKRKRGNNGN